MEVTSNGDVPSRDIVKKDTAETAFKAPSFVLAGKKKIKASSEAQKAFQSPTSKSEPPGTQICDQSNADEAEKISQEDPQPVDSVSDAGSQKAPYSTPALDSAPEGPSPVLIKQELSPAEQLKLVTQTTVPYKEPPWSSVCEEKFALEVIKNGAVVDNIDLTTANFHIVGRLPSCDIPMEHPSLSRHHAVVQYSGGGTEEFPQGWYLYDLDSTHGTWINKNKVPQKKFHRIHVDYVLKFGGSTRLFILQGPDTDRQEESELSVSQMKEQREKQIKEAELLRQADMEEAERKAELMKQREELVGCSWGINENEEVEEDENAENPFAAPEPENESLYISDPKKSLNSYFEREGLELPEYDFHEAGFGKWKCSVELPIDAPNGESMVAEVLVSGKKKDAVVACALEACRILDRHGELRKSAQESRKRRARIGRMMTSMTVMRTYIWIGQV